MTAKRASLSDRQPKRAQERGRGVDALFEGSTPRVRRPEADTTKPAVTAPDASGRGVARPSTFNLFSNHQNFLDSFVREGKQEFRERDVGVGAINKSAVLQEMLEILEADKALQRKVMHSLELRNKNEGSRHDPSRNK